MGMVARCGFVLVALLAAACRSDGARADGRAPEADGALPDAAPTHPLDPLTAGEIATAVEILSAAGHADSDSRFPELVLAEPPKAAVLAWKPGDPLVRRARVVVLDRKVEGCASYEAIVDLRARKVESWTRIEGAQPMFLIEEYELAGNAVRADARWLAAMAKRGVAPEDVYLDVWAPGEMDAPGAGDARIARVIAFHQHGAKSPYGPPIEGVVAVVDMSDWRVVQVLDTGVAPLPEVRTDFYDPTVTGSGRAALPPLVTASPEGHGFAADGHELSWDRWRMRWSFTQREGLVLHQVGWDDGERVRPIAYRVSISEMLVPYADPTDAWSWRSAFDEGEYGLGRLAAKLEPGLTVPENALVRDVVLADDFGEAFAQQAAIAVWERDAGFLWAHYDTAQGTAARRARELVVGFLATIGNYDYACNFVFTQDGAMEFEAVLTGSLLTKAVHSAKCATCDIATGTEADADARAEQKFGTLVAEHVLAPNHQHFINVRLDLDVEGPENAVVEREVHGEPAGPTNPRGNAFFASSTPLATERDARRDPDPAAHRCWEVVNPSARNAQGHPAAYALLPGATSALYLRPETTLHACAAFAQHAFHATRYRDGELYAAGSFTGQNHTPGGLATWSGDESLTGDVVVWYTVGVTHVPRPEEFPIMNATRVGFELVPTGFFDRNPGLDVPE